MSSRRAAVAPGWRASDAQATRRAVWGRRAWWFAAIIVGALLVVAAVLLMVDRGRGPGGEGPVSPRLSEGLLLGAGLALFAAGAAAAWRLRSITRILRNNPWVVAEARSVELAVDGAGGRSAFRMVELSGAPDDGAVLAVPAGIRSRNLEHLVPAAWVAGSDGHFIAAAPGGGRMRRMRRARLTGGQHERPPSPLRSRLDNAD